MTAKLLDVIVGNPGDVAVREYPVPDGSISHPANAAVPEVVDSGFVVHVSVAPLVPVAIARVTLAEPEVTVFPPASRTTTVGWVANAVPAGPPPGCWLNASFAAGPTATVNVAGSPR
ncbi:MAG: hypothetical protein WAL50_08495 [Kineosporiaceae bacterium]